MRSVHPQRVEQAQKRLFRDAMKRHGFIAGILFVAVMSGVTILVQMYSLSVLIDGAFMRGMVSGLLLHLRLCACGSRCSKGFAGLGG